MFTHFHSLVCLSTFLLFVCLFVWLVCFSGECVRNRRIQTSWSPRVSVDWEKHKWYWGVAALPLPSVSSSTPHGDRLLMRGAEWPPPTRWQAEETPARIHKSVDFMERESNNLLNRCTTIGDELQRWTHAGMHYTLQWHAAQFIKLQGKIHLTLESQTLSVQLLIIFSWIYAFRNVFQKLYIHETCRLSPNCCRPRWVKQFQVRMSTMINMRADVCRWNRRWMCSAKGGLTHVCVPLTHFNHLHCQYKWKSHLQTWGAEQWRETTEKNRQKEKLQRTCLSWPSWAPFSWTSWDLFV